MDDEPVVWRDYRPSNGTEGDYMRAQTCDRCVRDHAWHVPPYEGGESCPIIMDALAGEHSYPSELGPPQWSYWPGEGRYECSDFEGPCECEWEREAMRHRPSRSAVPVAVSRPRKAPDGYQPVLDGWPAPGRSERP